MEGLVLLAIFGGIAFAIAHFLGRKRQIGFGWSFFFCLFLSPIGGFITTMLSRKYYDPNPEPSSSKKVWGWILIVLFSLSFLVQIMRLASGHGDASALNALFMAVGFIGLGFYLIELGKGKNFNTEALTKSDE
jgi:heme/copper-type cytochrome/quinol oxidase subunit 3